MTLPDAPPQRYAVSSHLRQIVAELGEGVILLDPDQQILWANEAALAMHGVSRLAELGENAAAYRDRFELRYLGCQLVAPEDYPMARVLRGERFRDMVVAVTPAARDEPRWVHRSLGLVLAENGGAPDCLAVVLDDITEQLEAEERFERTFNANPAPAIICRLTDLRFVKVNQGFLELTGYAYEAVLGRSVYELDVLGQAKSKDLAIERLNAGRTIPQMEAVLSLADGRTKFVIVAGQPIELGDDPCMLFTFVDLEPRKEVEDALRRSEERFAKSFRLTPVATLIRTLDEGRLIEINEAFTRTTGFAAAEATGRTMAELGLWHSADGQDAFEEEFAKVGSLRNRDMELRTKEGHRLDCLVSAEIIDLHGIACVLSVLQDITDRKRSEVELIAAIEEVMKDASWFSRTVIEKLANLRQPARTGASPTGLKDLTRRELQVLGLLCQGLADKEIAARLRLSSSTVRNCLSTIYRKIGVRRRNAAVVWARERGFVGGLA
jgi:PAS domain S-box-containing protein